MQAVFTEWASRTAALPVQTRLETGEDESPEHEGISPRGLEILQVLNDVFNTLPYQVADSQD
jgi:hypothetical protein